MLDVSKSSGIWLDSCNVQSVITRYNPPIAYIFELRRMTAYTQYRVDISFRKKYMRRSSDEAVVLCLYYAACSSCENVPSRAIVPHRYHRNGMYEDSLLNCEEA